MLDFYHATQYLGKVAKAVHPRSAEYQQAWMDVHCHILKHEVGAATRLVAEMEAIEPKRVSESVHSGLQDAITYFRNHHTKCIMPKLLPAVYPSVQESPKPLVK